MACGVCGSIEEGHMQQSAHGFAKINRTGEPIALIITAGNCPSSVELAQHLAYAMREMKRHYPDKDFLVLPATYKPKEHDRLVNETLQVSQYIAIEK